MAELSKLDMDAWRANGQVREKQYWITRMSGLGWLNYFEGSPAAGMHTMTETAASRFEMPPQLAERIIQLAASPRAQHILLLAALGILGQKCASAADVVVFTPGYPENGDGTLIPVRMSSMPASGFARYILTVKESFMQDLNHGNYPVSRILAEAGVLPEEITVVGMLVEEIQSRAAFERMPADVCFCFQMQKTPSLTVWYKCKKFEEGNIRQLAGLFFNLLGALLENIRETIRQVAIISVAEKNKILNRFNCTKKVFPDDKTLLDFFDAQVYSRPDAVALECGNRTLSWQQLHTASDQVAAYLADYGLTRGNIVGVMTDRSPELIITVYGILKAGCVYLPLAGDYPEQRVLFVLKDSNATMLITDKRLPGIEAHGVKCISPGEAMRAATHRRPVRPGAEDYAYIIYTSGSTGTPKGVLIRHRSVVNRLNWMQNEYLLTGKDVILQKTPVVFDVSVWELFWMCFNGARLVLAAPGAEKDPAQISSVIQEKGITVLHFVPAMLNAFTGYLSTTGRHHQFESIRHIFCSGEELIAAPAQALLARCPHAGLHNLYGPTEATVDVSAFTVLPSVNYIRIPIGKPIDNTSLFILNSHLQLQPVGLAGELFIGGVNLSAGYLNRPELTHDRFIKNPLDGTTLLYRTGDIARWLPDGNIEYLGRADSQVKIRGNRVELAEIEHAVRAFRGIKDAVVLTKESGAGLQLACYLVVNGQFLEEDIRAYLASQLPDYMMPSWFVPVDSIPVTINGKTDRKKLLSVRANKNNVIVHPGTQLEQNLLEQWKQVLKTAHLGVTDSFFRSGGDSILAVKLIGAVNYALSVNITMADLYNNDTVEKLAAFIEQTNFDDGSAPYQAIAEELEQFENAYREKARNDQIEAVFPMSDIEKAMCFAQKVRPEDILYFEQIMQPVAYETLDVEVLQQALSLLVQKHAILRTAFDLDEMAHIVYREVSCTISFYDFSDQPASVQQHQVRSCLELSRQHPFDLARAPLWKISVFRLAGSHHEILFEYHHAILDGWSIASLITELNNTYGRLLRNMPSGAKPLECGYRDYIMLELLHKRDERSAAFWQKELQGFKKLRLGRKSGPRIFRSARQTSGRDLVDRLASAATQQQVTVKNILLSAYLFTMKMLSGESDITTGLVTFTRPLKKDGDRILGCFLNTIPLRIIIPDNITWLDLLKRTEKKLLELKRHEHLSLSGIARAAGHNADGENPFFDTQFNYINWHITEELQLEKTVDTTWQRLQFDSFIRGNTFFDTNYNVNAERILCMHEYATPFMDELTFNLYTEIFNTVLDRIIDQPAERIDPIEFFWKHKLARAFDQLQNVRGDSSNGMLPASLQQEIIWRKNFAATGANGGIAVENISLQATIVGPANGALLEKCLQLTVTKYELLRTKFVEIKDRLWQTVNATCAIPLRHLHVNELVTGVNEWVAAETARPFSRDNPFMRATLLQENNNTHTLLLVAHPLIADRYTVRLLLNFILDTYTHLLQGYGMPPDTPLLPYAEYAAWQQEHLLPLKPFFIDYWRRQAGSAVDFAQLPADKPATKEHKPAAITAELPQHLVSKTEAFAKLAGADPEVVLIAVFKTLLHRYTEQETITIGTVAHNRRYNILKQMAGPLSGIALISSKVLPADSFSEYVTALQEIYRNGQPYHAWPFNWLAGDLAEEDNLQEIEGPAILFEYEEEIPQRLLPPNMQITINDIPAAPEKCLLKLCIGRREGSLQCRLGYNAAYFTGAAMQLLLERYIRLLSYLPDHAGNKLAEASMLTGQERHQLVNEWNDTAREFTRNKTITDLFDEQAAGTPQLCALKVNGKMLTYREVQEKSDAFAAWLAGEAGVQPGHLVGIMLEREENLIPAIFGIMKAGAAYVPLDPRYPAERKRAIISHAKPTALITRSEYLHGISQDATVIINLDRHLHAISTCKGNPTGRKAHPGSLAYVIYTSGSTGQPKGVMIEHHSLVNLICCMQRTYPLREGDTFLLKTNICFDVSASEIFGWFLQGGSLSLLPPGEEMEPAGILNAIAKDRVTHINFVPAMFAAFVDELKLNDRSLINSLRYIFLAGEALPRELVAQFWLLNTGITLENLYGPTECTVYCSGYATAILQEEGRVPIGRPLHNMQMYVVDAQGNLAPAGVEGELCVAGEGLARGYLHDEELTAQKFVENPFGPAGRMYKTGDRVRWLPDGNLDFLGRIDAQVKISGYRIEPGEIESRLAEHELVRECVVVVRETGGEKFLVACYVADEAIAEDLLRAWLLERLPAYMVPAWFVHLTALPLTAGGKINRKAIPLPLTGTVHHYIAPDGDIEEKLTAIWSEILHLDKKTISTDKNFFQIGGHSLRAMTLANRIFKELSVKFPLKEIFKNPTVKQQGQYIKVQDWLKNAGTDEQKPGKIEIII